MDLDPMNQYSPDTPADVVESHTPDTFSLNRNISQDHSEFQRYVNNLPTVQSPTRLDLLNQKLRAVYEEREKHFNTLPTVPSPVRVGYFEQRLEAAAKELQRCSTAMEQSSTSSSPHCSRAGPTLPWMDSSLSWPTDSATTDNPLRMPEQFSSSADPLICLSPSSGPAQPPSLDQHMASQQDCPQLPSTSLRQSSFSMQPFVPDLGMDLNMIQRSPEYNYLSMNSEQSYAWEEAMPPWLWPTEHQSYNYGDGAIMDDQKVTEEVDNSDFDFDAFMKENRLPSFSADSGVGMDFGEARHENSSLGMQRELRSVTWLRGGEASHHSFSTPMYNSYNLAEHELFANSPLSQKQMRRNSAHLATPRPQNRSEEEMGETGPVVFRLPKGDNYAAGVTEASILGPFTPAGESMVMLLAKGTSSGKSRKVTGDSGSKAISPQPALTPRRRGPRRLRNQGVPLGDYPTGAVALASSPVSLGKYPTAAVMITSPAVKVKNEQISLATRSSPRRNKPRVVFGENPNGATFAKSSPIKKPGNAIVPRTRKRDREIKKLRSETRKRAAAINPERAGSIDGDEDEKQIKREFRAAKRRC